MPKKPRTRRSRSTTLGARPRAPTRGKKTKKRIQYGGIESIFIAGIAITIVAATGNLVKDMVESDYFADNREMIQSTGNLTGQLAEEEQEIKALTDDERRKKSIGFFLRRKSKHRALLLYRHDEELRRIEKKDYLKGCRNDVRKSNSNIRLPIMLRCYRGELTLDLEDIRKERAFLYKLPGTSDEAKERINTSIVPLMDSITAVIDGIDAGVYTTEEGLVETKKNLTERYKAPYWLSVSALRADGLLSWTSHLIRQIDLIMVGTEDSDEDDLKNTRGCYEDAELMLLEIPFFIDHAVAREKLQRGVEMIESCIGTE
ncbi:MAG: hypothetical protein QF741_00095 [Candidatus Peribacteraceae bacterium]|jgi:hypothetical protein|nr:hypothetical protein [Candidatus Peribacteraceae bacterium]MDP7454147.1 hypothetical protein [Candidatus Peribacteraceae bacterium]|tara:strand:+ start:1454 stop:2401 length:948 start_codon:yes stop_codon:yes gene_type:complete